MKTANDRSSIVCALSVDMNATDEVNAASKDGYDVKKESVSNVDAYGS
jgi:hypothetical protein